MGRKTRQEAEATRERILDSAEVLFASDGVSSVALTRIARHAGVTTGALYGHFDDKNALLCALFARANGPVSRHVEAFLSTEAGSDNISSIEAFILRIFDEIVGDQHRICLFQIMLTHMEMTAKNVLTERYRDALARLNAALRHGIDLLNSERGASDHLQRDNAATFLATQLVGSLRLSFFEGSTEMSRIGARRNIRAAVAAMSCADVASRLAGTGTI
ncbi:TetR family transcriptional regulator [Burkholderia anthina]|uniref:TetR family transcriptional regulator n=1 Tax=Burkholderia anthina TaxID=179879 RepID=UPI0015896E45